MVIETPPSGGFPPPGLALDFIGSPFRRRYAMASPPSDGVTSPNGGGYLPGGLTSHQKDPAGSRRHGGRAFFAVPFVLGPPEGPPPPSTSGGDLNKGLLSRPSASSARSPLTVRLTVRLRRAHINPDVASSLRLFLVPVGAATSRAPIPPPPNATTRPASTACGAATVSPSSPHLLQQFYLFSLISECCSFSPTPFLAPPGPVAGPAGLPASVDFVPGLFQLKSASIQRAEPQFSSGIRIMSGTCAGGFGRGSSNRIRNRPRTATGSGHGSGNRRGGGGT